MFLGNRRLRFFLTSLFAFFLLKYAAIRGGSILSREDLIQFEGNVIKILGAGIMEIQCLNDVVVRGRLSGRMKKHRIKVMVGDRVQVSVSPYDPSHGLITYRMK